MKIAEVDPGGHFVKILNCAPEKEESIGDYLLKQDVQGQPVAVFQSPPETRMGPNSIVTMSVGGLSAFSQLAEQGTLLGQWCRVRLNSVFSEGLTQIKISSEEDANVHHQYKPGICVTCPAFHVAQQWEASLESPCLLHSFFQPLLP